VGSTEASGASPRSTEGERSEPAETVKSPGWCCRLAPAHPPGAPRRLGWSTTGRSSGVSLPLDLHIARRAERLGGRCPFAARSAGCPAPVAAGAPSGCPETVTPPARSDRLPDLRLRGWALVRLPGPWPMTPFTLTRLPVPTPVTPGPNVPPEQLGCPLGVRPVALPPVSTGKPAARYVEALAPLLAAPGCPVARRLGTRGFSSRPNPLPPRGPCPSPLGEGPEASVERLGRSVPVGVRCPVRGIPSRRQNPRSRAISKDTGLSTNKRTNPQNSPARPPLAHSVVPSEPAVHPQFTVGETGHGLTIGPSARLNGVDVHRSRRHHHHFVEHVVVHVLVKPPHGRLFCCPEHADEHPAGRTGRDSKEPR
jgi:hypothetical protein